MSWKEIYNKYNHNEYSQVTNILKTYILKSNIKNFLKNYGKLLLIGIIIFMILLTYTFRSNLLIVLYCTILMLLIMSLAVFSSIYNIYLKKDKMVIKLNFQNIDIQYSKLGNIYLEQNKLRILFIPIYYYNLKITYLEENNKVNMLSFPTIMLNKKNIIEFFECLKIKEYQNR